MTARAKTVWSYDGLRSTPVDGVLRERGQR